MTGNERSPCPRPAACRMCRPVPRRRSSDGSREEDLDQLKVAAGWCREEDRDVIWLHLYEERRHERDRGRVGRLLRRRASAILPGDPAASARPCGCRP